MILHGEAIFFKLLLVILHSVKHFKRKRNGSSQVLKESSIKCWSFRSFLFQFQFRMLNAHALLNLLSFISLNSMDLNTESDSFGNTYTNTSESDLDSEKRALQIQ